MEISHIFLDVSTGFALTIWIVSSWLSRSVHFSASPDFQASDFVISISLLTWGVVTWVVDSFY